MHAALKQKFMSCFLNTPELQQVDKGVQIILGHILQFVTGSDEEPLLGFRVAPSIEFVEPQVIAQTPTQNALFYLLLTHVQIPCTYQDVQMGHCCQVRSNYLSFANAYFGKL